MITETGFYSLTLRMTNEKKIGGHIKLFLNNVYLLCEVHRGKYQSGTDISTEERYLQDGDKLDFDATLKKHHDASGEETLKIWFSGFVIDDIE